MLRIQVVLKQLPHAAGLPLPEYQSAHAAGMDLPAAVDEPVTIRPGARTLIPTGLVLAIPEGYEAQIRPRSGLALKHGITLPNTPGTIDADYRGEVKVIVANIGDEPFTVQRGERIAQIVFTPIVQADLICRDEVPTTERGDGGFGSTGS